MGEIEELVDQEDVEEQRQILRDIQMQNQRNLISGKIPAITSSSHSALRAPQSREALQDIFSSEEVEF